jgi:hypothetical protein
MVSAGGVSILLPLHYSWTHQIRPCRVLASTRVCRNPPTDQPYTVLKEQLTKHTSLSEQRKLQQLLTGKELGDRKPTQLLRRMRQLLGDRLIPAPAAPHNVRNVLASTPDSAMRSPPPPPPHQLSNAEVGSLLAEVSCFGKLAQQLARPSRSFSRNSRRSPLPSPTPAASTTASTFIANLATKLGAVVSPGSCQPVTSSDQCRRPHIPWLPFSRAGY